MSFTVHDVPQLSPEWFALRVGLVTGSCANDIIAERKRGSGELKARATLRRRLICERITGLPVDDTFVSWDMERGLALEADAFAAYEAATGLLVHRAGFVSHDTIKAGCSPDGFVGNWEGVIELKAPKQTTHLEYLQAGTVPDEYRGQIMHALWLTGAEWCDFCSYDPRWPAAFELVRVRVQRKDVDLVAYELALTMFISEVDRDVAELLKRCEVAA